MAGFRNSLAVLFETRCNNARIKRYGNTKSVFNTSEANGIRTGRVLESSTLSSTCSSSGTSGTSSGTSSSTSSSTSRTSASSYLHQPPRPPYPLVAVLVLVLVLVLLLQFVLVLLVLLKVVLLEMISHCF